MGVNRGKEFENQIKESFLRVPNCSVDRLHDQMSGYAGSKNICDFIIYRRPNIVYLECKSCLGRRLPLSNITMNQLDGLARKALIDGVCAGIMVWFVDQDVTYFLDINYIMKVYAQKLKSIHWLDLEQYEDPFVFKIPGKKKRVFFDYDMQAFLDWVGETYA